jgi:hypothetical protein
MDSDKVSFIRAILNDAHYWMPALGIIIFLAYMFGRFVYLEKRTKPETTQENGSILVPVDTTSKKKEPIKDKIMEEKPKQTGDTYNVTSNNQTGGLTVGKIEQTIVTEKLLSENELLQNLEITKKVMKDSNLNHLDVHMEARSNGHRIYKQLMDFYVKAGLNPMGGVTHDTMIETGIVMRISGDRLVIIVGLIE